jgi:hypothetical protein
VNVVHPEKAPQHYPKTFKCNIYGKFLNIT